MTIEIYTDGAALGNPGPGGYGVILKYGKHRKELSAGYRLTTNNRMELTAVIVGLEALKGENLPVTVFSDSRYVTDAVIEDMTRRPPAIVLVDVRPDKHYTGGRPLDYLAFFGHDSSIRRDNQRIAFK